MTICPLLPRIVSNMNIFILKKKRDPIIKYLAKYVLSCILQLVLSYRYIKSARGLSLATTNLNMCGGVSCDNAGVFLCCTALTGMRHFSESPFKGRGVALSISSLCRHRTGDTSLLPSLPLQPSPQGKSCGLLLGVVTTVASAPPPRGPCSCPGSSTIAP